MKTVRIILAVIALSLVTMVAFAQSGAVNTTNLRGRLSDTTTLVAPSGYGSFYYNVPKTQWWIVENGTKRRAFPGLFTSTAQGLTPASGGGSSNFLRADGTWAAPAGGISGSGTNTYVTYWTGTSAISGEAGFTYNAGSNTLQVPSGIFSTDLYATYLTATRIPIAGTSGRFEDVANLTWDTSGDRMIVTNDAGTLTTYSYGGETTWDEPAASDFVTVSVGTATTPYITIDQGVETSTLSATLLGGTSGFQVNASGGDLLLSSTSDDVNISPAINDNAVITTTGIGDVSLVSADNITVTPTNDFIVTATDDVFINGIDIEIIGSGAVTMGSTSLPVKLDAGTNEIEQTFNAGTRMDATGYDIDANSGGTGSFDVNANTSVVFLAGTTFSSTTTTGNISFSSADDFTVGAVNDIGLTAEANVTVAANAGNITLTPSSLNDLNTATRFNTSINNGGTALKHGRVTTGSITGLSTVGTVTLTWSGSAFADTNYTCNCSLVVVNPGATGLFIKNIDSITTTTVVIKVVNDHADPLTGTIHCIAMHD